jgi:hypothetical protein
MKKKNLTQTDQQPTKKRRRTDDAYQFKTLMHILPEKMVSFLSIKDVNHLFFTSKEINKSINSIDYGKLFKTTSKKHLQNLKKEIGWEWGFHFWIKLAAHTPTDETNLRWMIVLTAIATGIYSVLTKDIPAPLAAASTSIIMTPLLLFNNRISVTSAMEKSKPDTSALEKKRKFYAEL